MQLVPLNQSKLARRLTCWLACLLLLSGLTVGCQSVSQSVSQPSSRQLTSEIAKLLSSLLARTHCMEPSSNNQFVERTLQNLLLTASLLFEAAIFRRRVPETSRQADRSSGTHFCTGSSLSTLGQLPNSVVQLSNCWCVNGRHCPPPPSPPRDGRALRKASQQNVQLIRDFSPEAIGAYRMIAD